MSDELGLSYGANRWYQGSLFSPWLVSCVIALWRVASRLLKPYAATFVALFEHWSGAATGH